MPRDDDVWFVVDGNSPISIVVLPEVAVLVLVLLVV
jgi:hypothetical protein